MADRRRPTHHVRHTVHGAIEVNEGVRYDDGPQATSGRLRGSLLDAARQLAGPAERPPIPAYTADVLLSEGGNPYRIHFAGGFHTITQKWSLDPETGTGKIDFHVRREFMNPDGSSETFAVEVGPGMEISGPFTHINMDLRRAHIPGLRCQTKVLQQSTFAEANMDGAVFAADPRYGVLQIASVCMDGASLRGAQFDGVALQNVSLVDVDATGAHFQVARLIDVDISGSNIHPDQFECPGDPVRWLFYDEYSLAQVADATGVDVDELALRVWAGEVEVRDSETRERVTGGYDAALHHIPQWEMQRLLGTTTV